MKNKKRWIALGLVAAMAVGTLAGCGGKKEEGGDGEYDFAKMSYEAAY